ncbi:hypothetical protein BH10PAT4_BH10PAT4_2840 [soil metagenome]
MIVKLPEQASLYTVSVLRPFGWSGSRLAELPIELVVVLLL